MPDLVILDYGMNDVNIIGDNYYIHNFQLPHTWLYDIVRWPVHVINDLFGPSLLIRGAMNKLRFASRPRNIERFYSVLDETLKLLHDKKVPVILMRTTKAVFPDFPKEGYLKFVKKYSNVRFLSVRGLFEASPPTEEDKADFNSRENWTDKFGLPIEHPWLKVYTHPVEYQLNIYQYNRMGMRVISRGLEEMIVRHYLKE